MGIIIPLILLGICFIAIAIICDDYFVKSLDLISDRFKLPSDVAGATLMAIGSSAPELFISIFALIKPGGYGNVGAGTIVGSALFNILVIVGASSLFKTAKLTWQPVFRDMLFYVISILLLYISFIDGEFETKEALMFLSIYVVYVFSVFKWKTWFPYKDVSPIDVAEDENENKRHVDILRKAVSYFIPEPETKNNKYIATFLISISSIAIFSYFLVEAGVALGTSLHISPTIIALTILASGTSIPDLLSSVIVAKKGRGDMAIANAVGSNIFDVLVGLGLPMLLIVSTHGGHIAIDNNNLIGSIILLFATVLAILSTLILRHWEIGKRSGMILISLYILYLLYSVSIAI